MNDLSEENNKKILNNVIMNLHDSTLSMKVKEKVERVLGGMSPLELVEIERELLKAKVPKRNIKLILPMVERFSKNGLILLWASMASQR